jgi:hypothetical protein
MMVSQEEYNDNTETRTKAGILLDKLTNHPDIINVADARANILLLDKCMNYPDVFDVTWANKCLQTSRLSL